MLTTYTVLLATLLPIALSSPVPAPAPMPQRLPMATADSNLTAESQLTASLATSNLTAQPEAVQDTSKKGGCSDMILVFARGTTELAPIGSLTGPPFVTALQKELGSASLDVQGVPYPADIPGFLAGGSPSGSKTMADMISTAVSSCPDSKVVMSGYSQGGQLVHNAAKILPAATMAKVSSVVIFGDPDDGEDVAGIADAQTKVICHPGDNICDGGALILTPHLTYSVNAPEAAKFAAASAGINSV